MKRLFAILLVGFLATACSKDDSDKEVAVSYTDLVGTKWKCIHVSDGKADTDWMLSFSGQNAIDMTFPKYDPYEGLVGSAYKIENSKLILYGNLVRVNRLSHNELKFTGEYYKISNRLFLFWYYGRDIPQEDKFVHATFTFERVN